MLRRLAELNRFEQVERVSTVSGGSLLVGLMMHEAGLRWPTSRQFQDTVYPALRRKLCGKSLQWGALRQFRPWRPHHAIYRAQLLAEALRKEWGITQPLKSLPAHPEWSINGTTAENGKRFRFKASGLGDYDIGYVEDTGSYSLADALAVSAAFPGAFGPLQLDPKQFVWRKREWDASPESATVIELPFRHLHLYDGGVYDNLGLEPLFDTGKAQPKHDTAIIVSDAGAPLQRGFDTWAMNPLRIKRVADIISEQARSLRVRTFLKYLQSTPTTGAYVYIAAPCESADLIDGESPSQYQTTLRCPNPEAFDAITRHGWKVASREFAWRLRWDVTA
jgi:NTE family protein